MAVQKKDKRFFAALLALSVAFYALNYLVFGRGEDILFYLVEDVAFLFVQVLLVTLIIQRILDERERAARMKKLNVVIGAFFSELGTALLGSFAAWDPERPALVGRLRIEQAWSGRDFVQVLRALDACACRVVLDPADLEPLKLRLLAHRSFMLRLMENPNLLEHEAFTDLLQAIFHLTEELAARPAFTDLPETDLAHLAGDVRRGYVLLIREWLHYMRHLQEHYPYLFSLALRTNPFDPAASVIVR